MCFIRPHTSWGGVIGCRVSVNKGTIAVSGDICKDFGTFPAPFLKTKLLYNKNPPPRSHPLLFLRGSKALAAPLPQTLKT